MSEVPLYIIANSRLIRRRVMDSWRDFDTNPGGITRIDFGQDNTVTRRGPWHCFEYDRTLVVMNVHPTDSVYNVVLQNLITLQIRQLIPHYY